MRLLTLFLVSICTSTLAQKKFDGTSLQKTLAEGNYSASLSKSEKLISKSPKEPLPYLVKAISLYKLQGDPKTKSKYKNTEEVAFKTFLLAKKYDSKTLKLDTSYAPFLNDYQRSLFTTGESLLSTDKRKADIYFTRLHHLFDGKHPLFVSQYKSETGYKNPDYLFQAWDHPRYQFCNTAENTTFMTTPEKEMVYLLNLVRVDPQLFLNTYVKRHKELHPYDAESSYFKSLEQDLLARKKAGALTPLEGLYKGAAFHAKDMGDHSMIGHTSSDGTDTWARIRREGNVGGGGENCSYGIADPLGVIFQLLIDDGIESLGHRLNMLNPSFTEVGIAQRPHKGYGTNTVMDFR